MNEVSELADATAVELLNKLEPESESDKNANSIDLPSKKKSSYAFEIFCVVLLGFGHMSVMTGFDPHAFVLESVIHSIHERDPNAVNEYAGYWGTSLYSASFMVFCLFSPSILNFLSPKWCLVLGTGAYTFYFLGFVYFNAYYFYITTILMGCGFACFYTGHSAYLMAHSSRETIQRNTIISWGVCCGSMLGGGLILFVIFYINGLTTYELDGEHSNNNGTTNLTSSDENKYRIFTQKDINFMFIAFAVAAIIANINYILIPSREVTNCIEGKEKRKRTTFIKQIKLLWKAFTIPEGMMLCPIYIHLGMWMGFWMSIYPTSFVFNKSLTEQTFLPAYFGFATGIGEIGMSCLVAWLNTRIKDFGMRPTFTFGIVLQLTLLTLIMLTNPSDAMTNPTSKAAILFSPSVTLVWFISIGIGLTDCCLNSSRTVICALATPKLSAQTFSLSKLFQGLGSMAIMFVSPYMPVYGYLIVFGVASLTSTILYYTVAMRTKRMEKDTSIYGQYYDKNKLKELKPLKS